MSSHLFTMALHFQKLLYLIEKRRSVHGFVMEQKNLKFFLTSCVWVIFKSLCNFEHLIAALDQILFFLFFFLHDKYVQTKEIDRRGDQALPVVIPGSLTVCNGLCVCACTDLFKAMACGVRHLHAYGECSWTRWIGSVLLFFHLKDWCGRGIFGTGCPLSENSLWFILSALGCLWTLTCSYCMTDGPDVESLLHDSEMTLSWIFCTLTLSRIYLSPSPLSLLHWCAYFLLFIHFPLLTFFSHCFYLLFFLAAAFSKPWLFFLRRQKASFTVVSAVLSL